MADVQTSSNDRRHGPATIKLDMTPLVDLAFLLLTFFILTTTLRRQYALDLALPHAGAPGKEGHTITFLLGGNDTIHGYSGAFDPGRTPLRRLGMDQVRVALRAVNDTATFMCVVRTGPRVKYASVVRMLDELAFLGPGHYSVEEGLTPAEHAALADHTAR